MLAEFNTIYLSVAFEALNICGALCSTAVVTEAGTVLGDASETAILHFLFNNDDPIVRRNNYPKVAEIPFNSVNKYQVR